MGQLSDGQKSRVVFAKIARESPHLLLLDEPTNHLDMESIDSLAKAINQFTGGMILVSHDMRLISQVAKEIWLCDNKTVAKYVGEINDFKMQLRSQILAGGDGGAKKAEIAVAPLVPKKMLATSQIEIPTIVPVKAPVVVAPPAVVSASSSVKAAPPQAPVEGDEGGEQVDEKALAKARRKAEKEAAAALAKKEEEERQRRREEKLKEAEEARLLKEAEKKIRDEMEALKAQQEVSLCQSFCM
jgi:energy-coupling factor transporter ATP-binding protein EcfA2